MPTVLFIFGWRLFFYANEGEEPIHIHCQKGDCECKYWLDPANFEIREAYSYNISPGLRRAIRKIIYNHFDYIVEEWNKFQEQRNG
ncbi:MAG: DUF4160 domain-containing protein [Spirochaetales bacterium]|nr:DUF4160 domain-containing protein [Spirochaetales bacterium]